MVDAAPGPEAVTADMKLEDYGLDRDTIHRWRKRLGRIRIDRTHIVCSIDPVNPVYIYKVEQIHAVDGIAVGDPINPDLL